MSTLLDRADGGAPAHDPLRVEPWDRFNRALVDHVHPPDWPTPTPHDRYDMVVIGGGTGGLVSAAIAGILGARVALVERHLLGGDCLNTGCVPSKAVIRAARGWKAAAEAAARFGGPPVSGVGSFPAAMERMRRIRAGIAAHDSAARFRDMGVHVFLGDARFVAPDAAEVGGIRLRFRRAVIATGGRPAALPVPGLAEAGYLTSETFFSLTELPRHLVVIGAGPIGCEMAQSFARFGARVTLLDMADRVLAREDPDAARIVQAALADDGVEFLGGARLTGVEREDGGDTTVHFERGGEAGSVTGDRLLVAAGRDANVEGLGLDAAGVRYTRAGVEVDERMRTSNHRVFAVGDVASRFKFTHAADAQARMVVRNALFFGRGRTTSLVIPACTYTNPEVAQVGLTTEEAAGRDDIDTVTVGMEETDRAKTDGDAEGFLRIHLRKGTDRILGATLVAEDAGDIIGHITQAMVAGVGLSTLGEVIHPYPTRAEILRRAADQHRRGRLTPLAARAFRLFFRLTR